MQYIGAVVCDVDGTLVNTDQQTYQAVNSLLLDLNLPQLTNEQFSTLFGCGGSIWPQKLLEWFPSFPYDEHGFWAEIIRREAAGPAAQLKPGAEELLSFLEGRCIPKLIATSSPLKRFLFYSRGLGLENYFDRVLTRETAGGIIKPNPLVYQKAAEMLGQPTEYILAIEDSRPGIEAATKAGCLTWFVPNLYIPNSEEIASEFEVPVFRSLHDIARALPALFQFSDEEQISPESPLAFP